GNDLANRGLSLVDGVNGLVAQAEVLQLRGVAQIRVAEIDQITIYKPEISFRRRDNPDREVSKKLGLARVSLRGLPTNMVKCRQQPLAALHELKPAVSPLRMPTPAL